MSEGARAAITRSSLRKELAARTRSTRSSAKSHRLNLLHFGNIKKQTQKSIRQKNLQETNKQTKVSFDRWVIFHRFRIIFFLLMQSIKSNRQDSLQGTKQSKKVSLDGLVTYQKCRLTLLFRDLGRNRISS